MRIGEYHIGEKICPRGGIIKKRIAHRIHNFTAYAWVLSDTFSLQWDIHRAEPLKQTRFKDMV